MNPSKTTNNNKNAQIMADLLRSGHTMLNLACPICNNPLFRNKEKEIFCGICNKKVIVKKENATQGNLKIAQSEKEEKQNGGKALKIDSDKTEYLQKIIEKKINYLFDKLDQENQIDLIEKYVKILKNLYYVSEKVDKNSASAGI